MLFPNLVTYHVYDGCRLPPFDAQAYQYILAGDGIFVRVETPFFATLMPIIACSVRGLAPLQFGFRRKVARIPEKLLRAALTDARRARRPDGGRPDNGLNEALYQFLHYGNKVQLRRPSQHATGVSVMAAGNSDANTLCELHSHGNMNAFWSRTDDADEQGARVYAVIGRLGTAPEIHVRVGVYGYWHPLPVTAVFTGVGGFTDLYHEENDPCPSTPPST
jgi:PRTRC genetic system protein A